jgi:hypothetical protein
MHTTARYTTTPKGVIRCIPPVCAVAATTATAATPGSRHGQRRTLNAYV